MPTSCDPPKPRKPLRERCPLPLSITPILYRDWNTLYDCNSDIVLVFEEEVNTAGNKGPAIRPCSPTPSLIEESHIVEVVPGLHIAVVDYEFDIPVLRTVDDELFTHVVHVNYTMRTGHEPLSLMDDWTREEAPRTEDVQRLDLHCPLSAFYYNCPDQMAVAPKELHAARDFLTLALPHGNAKWWPVTRRKVGESKRRRREFGADAQDDDADAQFVVLAPDYGIDELILDRVDPFVEPDDYDVNVLIVARRAVDVLAILFCYLAFLEGTTPEDISDTDFGNFWGNIPLGKSTMDYVGRVARCE